MALPTPASRPSPRPDLEVLEEPSPRPRGSTARCRVAIVGGGIAGLCAAYELSRTPDLRRRFDVTVYQLGWRLGGKLASGRNPHRHMRNEEHGLHVWFGFYDNAFRLAREVYERWERPDDCPFETVWDVLTPHSFTPFGMPNAGRVEPWSFRFARNAAVPGTAESMSPFEILSATVGVLRSQLPNVWGAKGSTPDHDGLRASGPWERDPRRSASKLARLVDRSLARIGARLEALTQRVSGDPDDRGVARLRRALRLFQRVGIPGLKAAVRLHPPAHNLVCMAELFTAFGLGLTDPRYGVLVDFDLDRLNHLDFRAWLRRHGASRELVEDWCVVRVPYDATFQYLGGDPARPSFEAGTAARFMLRAFFGYRNASTFLVAAGMGEALIAPLYEVLREQGVRFELFHELKTLGLSSSRRRIESLEFRRQARPVGETYEPLVTHGGLRCWPSEPDWSQLEDGEAMRARGVRFESRFGPSASGESRVLRDGDDFDEVILALPAGALRGYAGQPSCIEPLLEHQPRLRKVAEGLNLAPSVAAQLWCRPTTRQMGWTMPRAAMASWAAPYSVWADMTPVIAHEGWPTSEAPGSTHYLCGTWKTELHLGEADPEVATQAQADAVHALTEQLDRHGSTLWPATGDGAGGFDYDVLHADGQDAGARGPARLKSQYVRANIEPSDLCDGAAVGSSVLRPEAHESGVENAVLAGTWTRTNVDSTCVEAAVMSGLAAARVLTGPVRAIFAESFAQRRRPVVYREPGQREDVTWTVV